MIYRRVMRTPSLRKLTVPLAGIVLVLAGCGAEGDPPSAAGPCAIVENGTSAPTTSEAAGSQPEVATGYREGMTAVNTAHYAVATANPLATQEACEVLKDGGTAATPWSPHRPCWAWWSSRSPPGSVAAGSCSLRRHGQLCAGLRRQELHPPRQ